MVKVRCDDEARGAWLARGVVLDAHVTAFTLADCWVLAKRIHDLTGWQLCAVGLPRVAGQLELKSFRWDHMFVRTPDGGYLDVDGVVSEAQLVARHCLNARGAVIVDLKPANWRVMTAGERVAYPHFNTRALAVRLVRFYKQQLG